DECHHVLQRMIDVGQGAGRGARVEWSGADRPGVGGLADIAVRGNPLQTAARSRPAGAGAADVQHITVVRVLCDGRGVENLEVTVQVGKRHPRLSWRGNSEEVLNPNATARAVVGESVIDAAPDAQLGADQEPAAGVKSEGVNRLGHTLLAE